MGFPWGAVIGAAGSLAGGILGRSGGGADIGAQQQFSMQQLQMQEQFQREMAQNSIAWRVQDAKNAGVSPLAALGAPTFSPTVSAPGIDYSAARSDNSSLANGLSRAGANLGDAINKSMTNQDKSALLYQTTIQQQQIKSNDMDIAIKGAQLARLNQLLQRPGAPAVGSDTGGLAGQGMVKVVPDKVISGDPRPGYEDVNAGTHRSGQTVVNPGGVKRTSPTDPAIINNPSVSNPFMLRYMYDGYNNWFDRNITNPLRSVFGMPEYKRGN